MVEEPKRTFTLGGTKSNNHVKNEDLTRNISITDLLITRSLSIASTHSLSKHWTIQQQKQQPVIIEWWWWRLQILSCKNRPVLWSKQVLRSRRRLEKNTATATTLPLSVHKQKYAHPLHQENPACGVQLPPSCEGGSAPSLSVSHRRPLGLSRGNNSSMLLTKLWLFNDKQQNRY